MHDDFVQFDRETLTITVHFDGLPNLVIGRHNVDISFYSQGHGGQNLNKHMNGVRLIYNVPEAYRRLAVRTQEIIVRCNSQRHQHQNLEGAFHFLSCKLHDYFYHAPMRKQTRVPGWSKGNRLQNKKRQSMRKQNRGSLKIEN